MRNEDLKGLFRGSNVKAMSLETEDNHSMQGILKENR